MSFSHHKQNSTKTMPETIAPTQPSEVSSDLSATFAPTSSPEQSGGEPQAQPQGEGLPEGVKPPASAEPQAPKPSFTKEDVAEIIRGVQATPTQAPEEKKYTQEELNQMFNIWQPTEDLITQLGLPPEAAPALTLMRDGLIKQANTYVEARLAQIEKAFEAKYGPVVQETQNRVASEREQAFYNEHKDLAEHKETVQLILAQLRQQPEQPKNAQEASKLLADSTRAYLKKLGVELPAGDGGSAVTPPPVKMASLSGAGAGAAGRGAGSAGSSGVSADLKTVFG